MNVEYSTIYFCPHCRRAGYGTRMLQREVGSNAPYVCSIHTEYKKIGSGSIHGTPTQNSYFIDSINGIVAGPDGDIFLQIVKSVNGQAPDENGNVAVAVELTPDQLENLDIEGLQGPKGDPGEQGPQGPKGDPGETYNQVIQDYETFEYSDKEGKNSNTHRVGQLYTGDLTDIFEIKRSGQDYTVVQFTAPEDSPNESTLSLMRESAEMGAEFLDLYNMNYEGSATMGIRVQSRGIGSLRDFLIDFRDQDKITPAIKVKPTGESIFYNHMHFSGDHQDTYTISFSDSTDVLKGVIGFDSPVEKSPRIFMQNNVAGSSFELRDSEEIVMYSPGDIYLYGNVSINDKEIAFAEKQIQSIELDKDVTGAIVGGRATLADSSTIPVSINILPEEGA